MSTVWIGIDPGLSGAIAVIQYDGQVVTVLPIPLAGKEIDVKCIIKWLIKKATVQKDGIFYKRDATVYIEAVHSMPGQGVSSVFKFGFVTGILHGIIRTLGIPLYTVTPQAWKKEILAGTDKSKQASIDYVARTYPNVSLKRTERSTTYDHNMSDAICIAEYCRRKHSA